MISYLEGSIKYISRNYIILVVGGVGYKVFVPLDILTAKQAPETISLFIYTYVKEDALDLYGFQTPEDLLLYELFLTVSGIGPKTALAVFSNAKPEKIKEAIVKGDVEFFTTIPRLGRKNAQKVIIELRPKLGSLGELDLTGDGTAENKEIIEALKSFGFNVSEAKEAIKSVRDIEGDTSVKIRHALKFLGKRK